MNIKRILNWHPSLPDIRDKKYKDHRLLCAAPLPPEVDLRPKCGPIENQDQLGSCTSFAWAGMLDFLELQSLNNKVASPEVLNPTTYTPFSHLFLYYNERLIDGDVNSDSGSQLRTGAKALATYGDCSEPTWPYNENQAFTKPSAPAYAEAGNHKISIYSSLESVDDFKHCLADGFPFVGGITVYSSFESPQTAQTGIIPMPSQNDDVEGGHAICIVGYSDKNQWFICRNSWGTDWGDKGYFYLPYSFLGNQDLASDMWTARK